MNLPRKSAPFPTARGMARTAMLALFILLVALAWVVLSRVRARAALVEDEAHFLRAVDVHDRHEHVPAEREPEERHDRLARVRQLERDDRARLDSLCA